MGGGHGGSDFVGAVGHLWGTFRKGWLTIPSTGRPIYLRYGEFHAIRDGRIAQSTMLLDVLDVIRQAGFWPLPPSLGTEGQWVGPITADGVLLMEQDPTVSAASLQQPLAMEATLGRSHDRASSRGSREGLLTMPQKEF